MDVTILEFLILMLIQLVLSVIFLGIGFFMGRKTRGEVVFQPNPNKDTPYIHGEPVLDEYDPFEEAQESGKLENTVKDGK